MIKEGRVKAMKSRLRHFFLGSIFCTLALSVFNATPVSGSADFIVYSVYQAVNLGNPGELSRKDYYINMGHSHGLRKGSVLEVMRRVPTFDLANENLYREMIFPIARLKVIHVESKTAIARLDKMLSPEQVPAATPSGIIVGDVIRPLEN
jgi:hypothetical protein